jgi:hypothetical protein
LNPHRYTRTTLRPDGSRFVESLDIESERVAMESRGRGGRLEFLELVNRWNRLALVAQPGSPLHIFTAEVTSP